MDGLRGKVALVTGGSRGIGRAVAERLVAEGACVAITGRSAEALEEVVAGLGADKALGIAGNAGDPDHRAQAVRRTVEAFGALDLLVNNAGTNPVYGPLMELDLGAAHKILDVNVVGALAFVQEAHRAWMAEHGGAVVNIASVSGLRASPQISMYGASKAALMSLTSALALELGPTIRVNAVAPAVVKTRFAAALYEGREQDVAAAYPLGRLGEPDDVASTVAFLLSDEAAWLTGQTVVLDGGVTLGRGR